MRANEGTQYADGGPWGSLVAMLDGSFRMLATGASWSGHERNHLFLGTDGRWYRGGVPISGRQREWDATAGAIERRDKAAEVDHALLRERLLLFWKLAGAGLLLYGVGRRCGRRRPKPSGKAESAGALRV